jgi:hypothetical protein
MYSPASTNLSPIPAIYICSPYATFLPHLASLITTHNLTLHIYGRKIALIPFPTNPKYKTGTHTAITKTNNKFTSLD